VWCGSGESLDDYGERTPALSRSWSPIHRSLSWLHSHNTVHGSVSQPPGRGPVPDPGINYTRPRDVNIL
jgi:hypothetical protein